MFQTIREFKGKGFTIIETMVAIAVFALTMGVITTFIILSYRNYSFTKDQSMAINEARKGIEIMVKEIRQARQGEDGSYPIEKADDKEFIFYSDIDNDGKVERVRYFLGTVNSGNLSKDCVSFSQGGSCSQTFSNSFTGTLKSAQVQVSVEGDFGASNEYAEVFADGRKLGDFCKDQCSDCAGVWQGTGTFDVAGEAADDSIQFLADASSKVDPSCNWQNPGHSMKTKFDFFWTEELSGMGHEFKKGVIESQDSSPIYPEDQEEITNLSSYVRNAPPIFEYFDSDNNKIIDDPARLKDTKLIKLFLVINVNPNRPPQDFELESFVELRNLKIVQ
jgi:prepilin-type N-terminal cleavage/methylation domain-containing protein